MRQVLLAAALLTAAPAAAQSTAPPGAASCSGCHGRGAEPSGAPALRGQTADSIATAMQEYRTGQRPATVMDRIAKGFTDEESRAIAAWLAHEP